MKLLTLSLALTTLLACSSENELRYTATLNVETNGVALSEDGLDSYAAMSGTTCTINTSWGCPTDDADLPTDQEAVVDHYRGETLARSEVGVHRITGSVWDATADLVISNVRTAKLTDFGPLVLHQADTGCTLLEEDHATDVPASACAEGVVTDIDRRTGALYAATADGLLRISAVDGVQIIGERGDMVARDSEQQATYVATRDSNELWAVDDTGTKLWSSNLDLNTVTSISTRGDKGDVLVLGRSGDRGVVLRIEGGTGTVKSSSEVPTGEGTLVVSGNGQTLGIVLDDAVHYYAIEVDGEAAIIDPNPPSCIEIADGGFTLD